MKPTVTAPAPIDLQLFQAMPGNSALLFPDAPRFTILAATDDYLQTSGRTKEQLFGMGLFEAFPASPKDAEARSEKELHASLQQVLLSKKTHRLPMHRYDIPSADGSFQERYWSAVNKPVLNNLGAVAYIVHSAEDVTMQVQSEKREKVFQDLEKRYHELITAPILICILKGHDYTIALANDRTLDIWGRTAEVIGRPLLAAMPELQGQGFIEIMDEVKRTRQAQETFETPTHIFRNGVKQTYYIDFIFHPYFENDHDRVATGIICVAHDVTEQTRIRQQFKNVVEKVPDPVLILMGEDLVLEVANQALFDLWQVGPEALHKPFLDILPEMKDQGFVQLLKNVLHTGEPFYGTEVPAVFKRKDGREEKMVVNFAYQPYHEPDGSISGILITAADVTEQVLAKEKLQKSEQNLRNTILQSPVAMCILRGASFVVEVANQFSFEIWGKPAEAFLGKPIFEALPEAKNQGFEALLERVFTTGETISVSEAPISLPRNGGFETIYINFVYEPFREGDGSISGVIAVGVDVSEQVKARQKVEESIQEVRAIVDSAPFPIGVYTGKEMRIKLVNQSIIDVWGKGPDVVGKTYAEVLPELAGTGVFDTLEKVYTTGVPFHARNQRVDLVVDGMLQPFYFNYSFTPLFDAQGKVYGVMNTAAEITDLHLAKLQVEQSERNFRSMILQAPVAMCILLGPDHVVEVANDAIIELWGKPAGEVRGKPVFDALPDARNQGLEAILHDVYQTGIHFVANERPMELLRNGNRELLYLNSVYQPYYDAGGTILGVLAIAVDVTSQVQARQEIEEIVVQRTRELAEANEALMRGNSELTRLNANLEDFAYAASHDLKEPIRKIHFFSDRLRNQLQDKLNEDQKHIFERLETASRRMGLLVDDLLIYSHATKGMNDEEEVDLNQKIQLVLSDLDLEIQQKNAVVSVSELPVIKGSKRQMQQLFQNLVTNALKYSKPGTRPQIQIKSRRMRGGEVAAVVPANAQAQNFYLIEVSDNGIGFPQSEAQRIFNVFTRLHGNTQYKGSGVGLSIARKVVENHGGYIWAQSQPGEGSIFNVLLPGA